MATVPNFSSEKEALEWYRSKFEECHLELEEFQTSSKELEMELEAQLIQVEKENKDLKCSNQKLENERDFYAEKFTMVTTELKEQLEHLEIDLRRQKECNEELQRHIRGLEQNNDDLERAKRALAASLEEFDGRLNHAIERNAFLESELDEKEHLSVMVQRLKEETRDLKQEIHVQKKTPDVVTTTTTTSPSANATTEKKKPLSSTTGKPSGLDMVNDLLRRVGTLMNVALTPPPSRRRNTTIKKHFESNNNGADNHRQENTQN